MSLEGGPKVGFIEYSGFDTNASQGAYNGHQAKHLLKANDIITAFSCSAFDRDLVMTIKSGPNHAFIYIRSANAFRKKAACLRIAIASLVLRPLV
jgi:hypothetical protein